MNDERKAAIIASAIAQGRAGARTLGLREGTPSYADVAGQLALAYGLAATLEAMGEAVSAAFFARFAPRVPVTLLPDRDRNPPVS